MELLTPPEVAELLRVPENTLRRWRSEGKGPTYIKVEGHVRYRRDTLERFLADRTVEASA